MAVAPKHLRGDMRRLNTKVLAYIGLDSRRDVRVVAHRARQFASLHAARRHLKALHIAFHLFVPQCPFQSEGGYIGVHAVGAPDDGGVLELIGATLEHLQETLQVFAQNLVGLLQEVAVGGIHHIGRGQPVVHPLALFAQRLAHRAGECHHIVAGDLLYLVDTVHIKCGFLAQQAHILGRDNPQRGPRLGSQNLHL